VTRAEILLRALSRIPVCSVLAADTAAIVPWIASARRVRPFARPPEPVASS
jgi:hypothetical protein